MRKKVILGGLVILLLLLKAGSFTILEGSTFAQLSKQEMEQISGSGWVCKNKKTCQGTQHCANANNMVQCVLVPSPPEYPPVSCLFCDSHWGGLNQYCTGAPGSVTCWEAYGSCGKAFAGICMYGNCEGYGGEGSGTCGGWNACINWDP